MTEELTKNIIDLLKKAIENYNKFNVFRILNMREDSHTEFLKWLLENNVDFKNKFLEKIQEDSEPKIDFSSKQIDISTQKTNEGNNVRFDLRLQTENSDCIIEVKLDAKPSITEEKGKDGKYNITQMEKSCRVLNNSDKKEKYYVFLCPEVSFLDTKAYNKFSDKKIMINEKHCENTDQVLTELRELYKNKITIKIIDFSDIIKILFNICKVEIGNKKCSLSILEKICELDNSLTINNKKKLINESKKKDLSGVSSEYLKSYNLKIKFSEILNNNKKFSEDEINYLIHEYIEYWEHWNKFNKGYTKLVKYNDNEEPCLIWELCTKIKNFEEKFNEKGNRKSPDNKIMEILKS